MTAKYVVEDEQNRIFQKRRLLLEERWLDGKLDPEIVLPGLQALLENKGVVSEELPLVNWLSNILNRERQCHHDFFGREFDLTEFEKILRKHGRKKVKMWQNLGMEPHFLPKVSMMPGDDYPGWKVKPEEWFYKKLVEGKIFLNNTGQLAKVTASELEGITVLADTRLKPQYENGKQMYSNDNLLGLIIEQLRRDGKIARYEYGPQSSRFGISADEWENHIKPIFALKFGLEITQVRFEKTIEANVIPQLYPYLPRKDDGSTNTWVWYEEYFGGRGFRLSGGRSVDGGLADVRCRPADFHWLSKSVRPLAVLKPVNL